MRSFIQMNLYIKNTVENQQLVSKLLEPSDYVQLFDSSNDYIIINIPQLTYEFYTPTYQYTAKIVNTCDIEVIRELTLMPSIEAVITYAYHHAVLKPIGDI